MRNLLPLALALMVAAQAACPAQPTSRPGKRPAGRGSQEGLQEPKPPPPGPSSKSRWRSGVVARVNREVITMGDVWAELGGRAKALNAQQLPVAFEQTLALLIESKIEDQAVSSFQLSVSEFDLREHIESAKERQGGEQGYRAWLNERGITEKEFEQEWEKQTQRNYYLRTLVGAGGFASQDLRPEHNILPSVNEIREFYRRNVKGLYTIGRQVRVRYLTVRSFDHGGDRDAALAAARKIREDLATGADFVILARREMKNTDARTGVPIVIGGGQDPDLPPPEEVLQYAETGKVDAVSDPLPFRRGFHLAQVLERRAERVRPFSEVQFEIRNRLRLEKSRNALRRVKLELVRRAFVRPQRYKTLLLRKLGAPGN